MIELELNRYYYEDRTMGAFQLPNGTIIYTIERPWLNNEPFKSCIPEGEYTCKSYSSERFPDVWKVCNVEGRTHILIHIGNYVTDVVGCVAVGTEASKNAVYKSAIALDVLRNNLESDFKLIIRKAEDA